MKTVAAVDLDGLIDALSWAIGASGQSQAALARKVGLSQKHVSQMMTGRVVGSLRSWQALADAAGVRVSFTITPREPVSP